MQQMQPGQNIFTGKMEDESSFAEFLLQSRNNSTAI
jgi:hypothetical protein